jgi:hypothetical protein
VRKAEKLLGICEVFSKDDVTRKAGEYAGKAHDVVRKAGEFASTHGGNKAALIGAGLAAVGGVAAALRRRQKTLRRSGAGLLKARHKAGEISKQDYKGKKRIAIAKYKQELG